MNNSNLSFSFVDLFSGIGGFKIALSNNGGKSIGFSEINSDAVSYYCKNFKEEDEFKNFGDITKIKKLPPHDLMTAGVPCQSWSIAGRNLGFDDDRGQLWNDTIYLLKESKPKAFIFENVKGLVDPRNKDALNFILAKIKDAGYFANYYVINSHDFGVPQNRVRVFVIGFRDEKYFNRFKMPQPVQEKNSLAKILKLKNLDDPLLSTEINIIKTKRSMSLSSKNGFNEYFLFNDLRNGHTTIHSWEITNTTSRQKNICTLLLKNRRKSTYGLLDGNSLSIEHFKELDPSISITEIESLIDLDILKPENFLFGLTNKKEVDLSPEEIELLKFFKNNEVELDDLKINRELKITKIKIQKTLDNLKEKGVIKCLQIRYDFKNKKISTGLFGINRIFLPSSDIFPTLVASDNNDFIALEHLTPVDNESYKNEFIDVIYKHNKYRKITKSEACLIQGFPENFILPETRPRWMKLIGNSVSIPVIDSLCKAIIKTDVFNKTNVSVV